MLFVRTLRNLISTVALAALALPCSAPASTSVTLPFTNVFSGSSMSGTGATLPWVTASFANLATNTVMMMINASGLGPGQRIESLYFNLASITPSSLTFSWVSGPAAQSIGLASNNFKADGDGYYDVKLSYDTRTTLKGSANVNVLSNANPPSVYRISGSGLTASSFLATSSPVDSKGKGGSCCGPLYGAAHIQFATSGQSNWINAGYVGTPSVSAAPEPEIMAMMLVGFGFAGFAARRAGARKSIAA